MKIIKISAYIDWVKAKYIDKKRSSQNISWYRISMALPKAKNMPTGPADSILDDDGKHSWETIETIDRQLKDTSEIEEEFPELSYLGSGGYGIAYDIENAKNKDHVLKITRQKEEFIAAAKLMQFQSEYGKKIPHLVYIYQTKKIPNTNVYMIESERLDHPTEEEISLINYMKWFFTTKNKDGYLSFKNQNKNDIKEAARNFVYNNYYGANDLNREKFNLIIKNFDDIFDKYYEMAMFLLKKTNFKLQDAHGNNIGIRKENKEYVLFDLGLSLG